jgi:prevent-host-death family protein
MTDKERNRLVSTESLTEVRNRLPQIIDEVVSTGSEKIVSRHGRQVAVILSFDEYESIIETLNVLSDPATMEALAEADAAIAAGELVDFE